MLKTFPLTRQALPQESTKEPATLQAHLQPSKPAPQEQLASQAVAQAYTKAVLAQESTKVALDPAFTKVARAAEAQESIKQAPQAIRQVPTRPAVQAPTNLELTSHTNQELTNRAHTGLQPEQLVPLAPLAQLGKAVPANTLHRTGTRRSEID
jgi:hypothetical protein